MSFFSINTAKANRLLSDFFKISTPTLVIFYLLRIFEFFTSALKLELKTSLWLIELKACFFDTLFWLHLSAVLFFIFLLFYFFSEKFARWMLLFINCLILTIYFSLLIVFTERLVPFDHEFFMRDAAEAISTVTTEIGGKLILTSPLVLFIVAYLLFYRFFISKREFKPIFYTSYLVLSLLSWTVVGHTWVKQSDCKSPNDYHLSTNKLRYFITDCYNYLIVKKPFNFSGMSNAEIAKQIALYQQLNKHNYVSDEYPLLRVDDTKNVLANFLRVGDTVPNIVVIIYEGLSSDFSGKNASAGSFTPFLDSLAERSLSWYNCLSTAEGTFGSLPAICGSLPYGERGFTLIQEQPDNLTLVKILKKNNWQTNFMVGADPNFDNFAGFLRTQGIDHVTSFYGKKYKKMGVDADNWTIGYPDKALFSKAFEDLDSIKRTPYFSTYLTLTTHTPFIFEELHQYEKRFDAVLKKRNLPSAKWVQMNLYRQMFASFLYTDDCMRDFFEKYKKRPEYKNTIFVITGDHHHFFYPTKSEIDDYNVPLIIFSPLLKKPASFESVNSHFNIAPTLLSLLKNSYHLKEAPKNVAWIGDELDTCRTFRNIHHLPFILSNRDVDDFLYDDYYLVDQTLFKIVPSIDVEQVNDPKQLERMKMIRENFKFINAYVCQKNKLYPFAMNIFDQQKTELFTFTDTKEQQTAKTLDQKEMIHDFKPPIKYNKIMIKVSFKMKYQTDNLEELPSVATSIYDSNNKKMLFTLNKDSRNHINKNPVTGDWVSYGEEDVYYLNPLGKTGQKFFHFAIQNPSRINFSFKDLSVTYYGID